MFKFQEDDIFSQGYRRSNFSANGGWHTHITVLKMNFTRKKTTSLFID